MDTVSVICTASLGLLLFTLGMAVSALRFRERTLTGVGPDPSNMLAKAVRAHANTAEYAPFLAVLFLYVGSHNPSSAMLWLMVTATACRFLTVVGLIAWPTMARPNPVRFLGALGTYICGAALCVALLSGH
jgi:uncharacterized protein